MKFIKPVNNRKFLLVFVHGLIGGEETWIRKDGKKSILEYLADDEQIRSFFDIAIFKYDTTLFDSFVKLRNFAKILPFIKIRFTRNLPIRKNAELFINELESDAREYEQIVIVSHSMGGLISKQVILDEIERSNHRKTTPRIVLYISLATPHSGSELASLGELLLSNIQIKNLTPTNEYLLELNKSWVQSRQLPKRIYVRGLYDQVVPTGADAIDAEKYYPISSKDDHFSILIPSPETKQVLNGIKDACINLIKESGIEVGKSTHIEVLPMQTSSISNFWKTLSVIGFLLTAILLTYIIVKGERKSNPSKLANKKQTLYIDSLIQIGLDSTKRPYIIPNVLMNVDINKVVDSIEADVTLVYNFVQIRDRDEEIQGQGAFNDGYKLLSPINTRFFDLTSNENLKITSSETWWHDFEPRIGISKLPISKFKLKWPKSSLQTPINFWDSKNLNEVIFQYPNDDGDVIGELIIMISSSTFNLNNAYAKQGYVADIENAKNIKTYNPASTRRHTFVARFYNLRKSEHAQLRVTWD